MMTTIDALLRTDLFVICFACVPLEPFGKDSFHSKSLYASDFSPQRFEVNEMLVHVFTHHSAVLYNAMFFKISLGPDSHIPKQPMRHESPSKRGPRGPNNDTFCSRSPELLAHDPKLYIPKAQVQLVPVFSVG